MPRLQNIWGRSAPSQTFIATEATINILYLIVYKPFDSYTNEVQQEEKTLLNTKGWVFFLPHQYTQTSFSPQFNSKTLQWINQRSQRRNFSSSIYIDFFFRRTIKKTAFIQIKQLEQINNKKKNKILYFSKRIRKIGRDSKTSSGKSL